MRVIMRFYKSHDPDLIALHKAGFSLSKLARRVIEAYAHRERLKVLIPEAPKTDISDCGAVRADFSTSDEDAVHLLKSIENKRRNQFCKVMIRNALTEQPLTVFFTDPALIEAENGYLRSQKDGSGVISLPSRNRTSCHRIRKGLKEGYIKPMDKPPVTPEKMAEPELQDDIPDISGILSSMVEEF